MITCCECMHAWGNDNCSQQILLLWLSTNMQEKKKKEKKKKKKKTNKKKKSPMYIQEGKISSVCVGLFPHSKIWPQYDDPGR